MIQRIKELISVKAKSVREFASLIGINQVTLNQQVLGTRSISLEVVSAVLNSFEDISAEWLLRGKGDMYVQEKECEEPKRYDAEVEIEDGVITIRRKIEGETNL